MYRRFFTQMAAVTGTADAMMSVPPDRQKKTSSRFETNLYGSNRRVLIHSEQALYLTGTGLYTCFSKIESEINFALDQIEKIVHGAPVAYDRSLLHEAVAAKGTTPDSTIAPHTCKIETTK